MYKNMPKVAFLGSICTGHDCFPPRKCDTASGNVFVEGIPVHRQSDHWVVHVCKKNAHDSILAGGSGTVYVNGLGIGRVGDAIACGSIIMTGASTVYAGG